MSLVSRSTLHFIGMFLGLCVLMAGVGGFLALHDKDWRYGHDRAEERSPQHEGPIDYYDRLPADQQEVVDRAIDGEQFTFETQEGVPPGVVKKNGTFHVFRRHTVFDFTDSGTGVPVLVSFAGGALVVFSARADVRH